MSPRVRKLLPPLVALAAFAVTLWTGPAAWCRRGADTWIAGDLATQQRLARTVALQLERGLTAADYQTGNDLFAGEWLFGTHLMAGIGLCQLVAQHPETAAEWSPVIEQCIRQILSGQVRAFDGKAWKEDAIASLDGDRGHAAYLGYFNYLLGSYRRIHPANEFAALNDRITAALVRRLEASPIGLLETYPGERYPVDNAPLIASIALHGQATGQDHSAALRREDAIFQSRYVDPATNLLIQAVDAGGAPADAPRGSGTTLGIFFLHRTFPELAGRLFAGVRAHLASGVFGFGAIREYPPGAEERGDIDSGPILFGFGFSATGFGIAAARAFGDDALFARLYASAILAGAPIRDGDRLDFLTAGPLGNAILLAMFTTPRS